MKGWAVLICAALGGAASVALSATPESWAAITYKSMDSAETQRLGQVVGAFATAMGVVAEIDPSLASRPASPASPAVAPATFLDRLALEHRLQWFVYSGVLRISPTSDSDIERIQVAASSSGAAKQALIGLGLFEPKFGWGELDEDEAVVLVSGPQAYRNLVKQAIGRGSTAAEPQTPELMVFHLLHASALDENSTSRDRTMSRQGIATLLRSMFSGGDAPAGAELAQSIARGIGDSPQRTGSPQPVQSSPLVALSRAPLAPVVSRNRRSKARYPVVEGYGPTNSVLIYDLPEKREMYQELIAQLDVARRQVEIVASIVDVTASAISDWAFDVQLGSSEHYVRIASGGASASKDVVTAPTLVLNFKALSARLSALESRGDAKVLARPSVVTVENSPAMLELGKSVYFPLTSERTVDLKEVNVGTALRVTPRVQQSDKAPAIQLTLDIEDGSLDSATLTGASAQTSRSTISTQAQLLPGEALVIGGYRRESKTNNSSSIPPFNSIPIIGELFQSRGTQLETTERVVILSARLIPQETAP